jgi:hypothetical protein
MTSTSLVKTQLHNSIADSVYKEVSSRTGRYYYFIGKAIAWTDENNPPVPIDSFNYEKDTRKNIILVKEILPSDVAFVVDRKDWVSGTVYDMYDDHYSTELVGLNLVAGGLNYSGNTSLTISGGSGSGATGNVIITDGAITSVNLLTKGSGFINKPNVIISDAYGSGGNVQAVLSYAYSGASTLQDSNFYVVTDQYNIYKCLDNNNNARSTVKPTETTPDSFTTTDGYKWKFMGNVPIFLRNKFLSPTFMPVTTSASSNFYSKGEIRSVNILDSGSGYTYARIVVQGDGYLEDEPYLIKQVYVLPAGAGSGYNNANITIDPPVVSTTEWSANTFYSVGKVISSENNYYEVVLAGYTPSYRPIHTVGIKQNGNVALKFKGTRATGNITVSSGIISTITLDGAIRDVVITKGGSGYNSAPTITFEGGGGVNAAAYVNLVDNTVRRIVVTDAGKNYTSAPNVIIGDGWQANTFYDINDQVFYLTNLYTVTSNGYSNTTAPTHTLGNRTLGNTIFTYAGAKATATARLKYGAGYIEQPRANINGNKTDYSAASNANIEVQVEKTEAILSPYIDTNGRITRVNIENGGIGYTYGTLTVVGDGSNASLQINLSQGDLESLQSISELQTKPGAIHTIQVVSQGYNYANANITITGDGSGASANATIVAGRITKINMINEGTGYTNATVTITGSGKGASARAILPPYNGHGKDTINELFARNLGFYSTINQEENQGFIVTNDYRQFGIIKDVRNLNNSKYFNGGTGSACYLISGTVNPTVFAEDVIARRTSDNTAFLVISSSNSAILVSSLDETTPVVGDTISVSGSNSFVVTGVTNPDVDKYSGELVYIDNRRAFSTSEDQSVSLNTVIRF